MTASPGPPDGPIKFFGFIKRAPGTTLTHFREYWEQEHAPAFAKLPAVRQNVRRYELYHRLAADEERQRSDVEVADAGFDGVSVQWYDTLADRQAVQADAACRQLSADDGPLYRDDRSASVVTRAPDVIVGPPGGRPDAQMTLICILRHKPGLDLPEFHDHWLHHHGGLFQTIPELHDPLFGYEQNHGLDLPDAPFDGVTQQWFASLPAWGRSLEAPAHKEIVEPDVASFLDPDKIFFVVAGPPTVVIG
jgi:hypothetical protein